MRKQSKAMLATLIAMTAAAVSPAFAALDQGYGVIAGKPIYSALEPEHCGAAVVGSWVHYHLWLEAPAGQGKTHKRADPVMCQSEAIQVCTNCYEVAVDLFRYNPNPTTGLQEQVAHRETWMKPDHQSLYSGIFSLPNGYNALSSNPGAGAMDFLRHPGYLADARNQPLQTMDGSSNPLIVDPDNDPATKNNTVPMYDALVAEVMATGGRIYVFGEPFFDTAAEVGNPMKVRGMHNVHQNQGNLPGAPFSISNGVWQDGGMIFEAPATKAETVRTLTMTRFQLQKDFTYALPHPGSKPGDGIPNPLNSTWSYELIGNEVECYGPFHNVRQIEISLVNAEGDADIFVGQNACPTHPFNTYLYASAKRGERNPEYIRAFADTGPQPLYITVRSRTQWASGDLRMTYTVSSE